MFFAVDIVEYTEFRVNSYAEIYYIFPQAAWWFVNRCILRGPGGERSVDIVPGGTELELRLRRGVGPAAHTRNNPHVKCVGVY